MGKTFQFVLEREESVEKIRKAFSEAQQKIANEVEVQHGIKFKCEDGASFILYFSKGKASKIFFEKETDDAVSIIDSLCNPLEKAEPTIPVYASFSISQDNKYKIKEEIVATLETIEKEKKKDTIDYILEITEGKFHLTVTQFVTGNLLIQGPDSILVSQIKEIINKYQPISNKEEVLTYVEK